MGGSIEYRYKLKATAKNCRNCKHFVNKAGSYGSSSLCGACKQFHIEITDTTNATVCKAFTNKHSGKRSYSAKTKKQTKSRK